MHLLFNSLSPKDAWMDQWSFTSFLIIDSSLYEIKHLANDAGSLNLKKYNSFYQVVNVCYSRTMYVMCSP